MRVLETSSCRPTAIPMELILHSLYRTRPLYRPRITQKSLYRLLEDGEPPTNHTPYVQYGKLPAFFYSATLLIGLAQLPAAPASWGFAACSSASDSGVGPFKPASDICTLR